MKQLEISVSFRPQEEDFVLERLLTRRLRRNRTAVMVTRVAGLLLAAGGLVVLLVMGLKSVPALILADAMVVVGYILSVLFDAIIPFFEKRKARKEFGENESSLSERSISVSGDTITFEAEGKSRAASIPELWRAVENREAFLFLPDEETVWMLPRRLLNDEETFLLIGELQEKCGEKFTWIELSPGRSPKSKQERK